MNISGLAAMIAAFAVLHAPLDIQPKPAAARSSQYPAAMNALVDQDGQRFDIDRLSSRLVLVNFIFTQCGSTCPTQTMSLASFDKSLPPAVRDRLLLVSVSVDPAHDTPRLLKAYARRFGADQRRWTFLSGRPADIARVTRAFAAMRPGTSDASFHSSELRLFDAHARMIQRYAGAPLPERQLREDLLALLGPA